MAEAITPILDFLSFPACTSREGHSVAVLYGARLPSASSSNSLPHHTEIEMAVRAGLPDCNRAISLLYIHDSILNVTPANCRSFRSIYFSISSDLRNLVQRIFVLHPTAALRTAMYLFAGQEYSKITYCDLVEDVENVLGIDSLLLRLSDDVLGNDEVQRVWVGRHDVEEKHLDPSKPLLDLDNVDASWNNVQNSQEQSSSTATESHSQSSLAHDRESV